MLSREIVVCWLPLDGISEHVLQPFLTDEDRTHGSSFRDSEVSLRSLTKRALVRWCLNHFRGEGEARIIRTQTGKPFVVGGPYFNCSSAPGIVACAVCASCEMGLDVECKARAKSLGMSIEETIQWTEKEAIAKGVGTGLELAIDGLRRVEVDTYLVLETDEHWHIHHPKLPSKWVASVAYNSSIPATLKVRQLSAADLKSPDT